MDSTFEPMREFEDSEAAKILIPQYLEEKNESVHYGFYLRKSGEASYYYPSFVKNANQLFIYNYCYHSYEIINERFDKNKFLSSRDLPGRLGGICILSLIFNGIGQNIRDNIDINFKLYSSKKYKISFEIKKKQRPLSSKSLRRGQKTHNKKAIDIFHFRIDFKSRFKGIRRR